MQTPPQPGSITPSISFSEQEHNDIERALLMRLGFLESEIAAMSDYSRSLLLAFDSRANHLRDKQLAKMIAAELSQLFRK